MRKTALFTRSKRTVLRLTICLVVLGYFMFPVGGRLSTSLAVLAADPTVWSLVWSDEFNGPDGSAVDQSKWTAEVGGGGWGNNELEYYTTRTDNAYQSGGSLVIKAIKEKYFTSDYTSARLITKNKFPQPTDALKRALKFPMVRESGPPSGCSAVTSIASVGLGVARSTSWRISGRSRRSYTARFMVLDTLGEMESDRLTHCRAASASPTLFTRLRWSGSPTWSAFTVTVFSTKP